jgi:hypothetical protein
MGEQEIGFTQLVKDLSDEEFDRFYKLVQAGKLEEARQMLPARAIPAEEKAAEAGSASFLAAWQLSAGPSSGWMPVQELYREHGSSATTG